MPSYTLVLTLVLCAACAMAEEKSSAVKAVSDSSELFSMKFYKSVAEAKKNENLITSPLSAHIVLSMAAYGARGNTSVQLRSGLSLPKEDKLGYEGFQSLIRELNNAENVTLKIANKVYVADGMQVKSDFAKLTDDYFRSVTEFFNANEPAVSAKNINSWVDENTDHLIKEIIQDSEITQDLRMLLLNAVHFKGKWAKEFDAEKTLDRPFYYFENDEMKQKNISTMYTNAKFFYGELPDLKAKFIELPYQNKDLKMVIIVPDEYNGLSKIEENLEAFNYSRLEQSGYEQEVNLYLPKFKIESNIDLQPALEKLGMGDMFTNAANFSGIADEPLKVGKVIQKAFIEVDEQGSKAAAVTGMMITVKMSLEFEMPVSLLRVDRPFYYLIRSPQGVLFRGHVVDIKS